MGRTSIVLKASQFLRDAVPPRGATYQDDAQRAFAYAEILQDYTDDIWTRITVEKNRITVKCMVGHTAIVEYDLLDTAVLVFGQLEAAEAKRQHETGRVLLTTSPQPGGGGIKGLRT